MRKFMHSAAVILMTAMLAVPAYAAPFDISPSRPEDTPPTGVMPDSYDPSGVLGDGYEKAVSPQTGDRSGNAAAAAAGISGLGAAVLLAAAEKKGRKDEIPA